MMTNPVDDPSRLPSGQDEPMKPIDIILPIYGGHEDLCRCLESLLAHPQVSQTQLILINDASPFAEIHQYLKAFVAAHPEVEYLENAHNLGFVASVNRGMALHPDRDLVLLNSDTQVHGDWLDRLAATAYSNPNIATLTPFSNNATICSFPRCCEDNPLPSGFSLAEIDRAFATANRGQRVEIPSGVGFCMYIRRDALNQLGLFDEQRFGRGYGEENDFCRRAAAQGLSNQLCCDTFVLHTGGASFGGEKNQRAEDAQKILDALYPDYHRLVQDHIRQDPQEVYRLAAWLELLRSSPRPKILQITHHLGGGTRKHVNELMDHLRDQADFLLLLPLGEGRVELDLSGHQGAMRVNFKLPEMIQELSQLLASIGLSRIHFHHTLGLETSLWGLPERLAVPFDITLHDYYFINNNPTQTDVAGRYTADMEQQAKRYPLAVPLAQWQANQHLLLYKAERVISPSRFTIDLFRHHYPQAHYLAAYHPEWQQWTSYPEVTQPQRQPQEPLRILVFGAISIEKGADLLEQTAKAAREQKLPLAFHLIGYAYRPLEGIVEHGSYDHARIVEQIHQLQPHLIWFTALWPETYSYTLSEALASGLPIVAPNHGSFPERLGDRPLTWIEPWDQPVAAWVALFHRLAQQFLQPSPGIQHPWAGRTLSHEGDSFYLHHYLQPPSTSAPAAPALHHQQLEGLLAASRLSANDPQLTSRRERLLVRLVRLRHGRTGRWLSRLIPIWLQRLVKRRLSHRPLHEIF